jgi:3'(2'), 5'-bisphosphate nucleotidase
MLRNELSSLAGPVCVVASEAGRRILEIYQQGAFEVQRKADDSPLTAADRASHDIIERGLSALTPGVPVWSEESAEVSFYERSQWPEFWLVDPLDGTREFVKRNGEFTVNIALVREHRPVLGVICVPARDEHFHGGAGLGSFARSGAGRPAPIQVCRRTAEPVRVAGSRSHAGDSLVRFVQNLPGYQMITVGSSIKFCMVASGSADVYPRLGPTAEWDTAAGQAIVEGAGGAVTDLEGRPLRYNVRPEPLNPFFVAFGDASRNWPALLTASRDQATGGRN